MFEMRLITEFDGVNREKVKKFLERQGLAFDDFVSYTVAIFHDEKMIATGSMDQAVLKCVAVDEDYQGFGLTNQVVSQLMNEQHRRGLEHLFVYTKSENKAIFSDLGFYPIVEIEDNVILLENEREGISRYVAGLERIEGKRVAALVMNCNPFTLGHLHLVQRAARENQVVHLFVVSENRSYFSADVRYELVKEGVKDLANVYVHRGGQYIISAATFPSYFLKESKKVERAHAELDLAIFAMYFVKELGITVRYVGEELMCPVTAQYNRIMKKRLPEAGVKVVEIPRLCVDEKAISASRVRGLLKEGDYKAIKKLVPPSTYEYVINNFVKEKQ